MLHALIGERAFGSASLIEAIIDAAARGKACMGRNLAMQFSLYQQQRPQLPAVIRTERVILQPKVQRRRLAAQELAAQRPKPDRCELCGKIGPVVFDHCHDSGKFRGWICTSCNSALGLVKDNVQLLQSMAAYLTYHKE